MASPASIKKARDAILRVMANWHSVGVNTQKLQAVAVEAEYGSTDGKAFRTAVKNLKDEGIIIKQDTNIIMTDKGIKGLPKADKSPEAPSNEKTQKKILEKILKSKGVPPEPKTTLIFNTLLDGESHCKKDLAKIAGYDGTDNKPFRNLMAALKIFFVSPKGAAQFSDALFPFGRDAAKSSTDKKRSAEEVKESPPTKKKRTKTMEHFSAVSI